MKYIKRFESVIPDRFTPKTKVKPTKWKIQYRIKGGEIMEKTLESPYDNKEDFIMWWGQRGSKKSGAGKDKEFIDCIKIE